MARPTKKEAVSKRLEKTLTGRRYGSNQLTKAEDELIYQLTQSLGNKSEVARQMGVTNKTVYASLARTERKKSPTQLQEMRQIAAHALTESIDDQTHRILDSISDDDLKSGRIEIKDKDGNVVDYKYYGPSLLQKTTSVGILTDKLRVLRDLQKEVGNDLGSGALLMPESADQLLAAIKSRVESIQVLQVNLRKDHPDLATRLEPIMEIQAEAEAVVNDARFPFDK